MLAAIDNTSHLQALADLAAVLQDPDHIEGLIACQHADMICEKSNNIRQRSHQDENFSRVWKWFR